MIAGGKMCHDVSLFDVYTGEQIKKGYKSVAFNIKLKSDERTLVDSEIQDCMNGILKALQEKFGAELR